MRGASVPGECAAESVATSRAWIESPGEAPDRPVGRGHGRLVAPTTARLNRTTGSRRPTRYSIAASFSRAISQIPATTGFRSVRSSVIA